MQQRLCHSKPVTFTCISAPCKGIQDSLEFWIPHGGFRIPGTGFQSLPVEFGSRLQSLVGPWAVFRIPKPRIQDSTSTFSQILDPRNKLSWFRNPDSATWGDVYEKLTNHRAKIKLSHIIILLTQLSRDFTGYFSSHGGKWKDWY